MVNRLQNQRLGVDRFHCDQKLALEFRKHEGTYIPDDQERESQGSRF